jgi:uncharacterized membrane protein YhhN
VKTALYFAPVLALTVYLLIRAELRGQRNQVYLFKPLSTLLVIAAGAISFLEADPNPIYNTGMLIGLVLSLGGDIALMFDQQRGAFLAGLALFLAAHIAYGVAFTLLTPFTPWDAISGLLLLACGLVFYQLIAPRLGSMKLPVVAYILIISLMVNRAFSTLASPGFNLAQALMVGAGALLFYLSDMVLAANRFWRPLKYHRLNLALYYAGQFLIALAGSYFS